MIKKILFALATASMVMAPVAAQADDRYDRRHRVENSRDYERHRRHRDRRGGINTGEAVAIGLGAIILGSMISDSKNRDRDQYRRYDNEYIPPDNRYDRRYCVREQITEWYRGERYVFWETRCN